MRILYSVILCLKSEGERGSQEYLLGRLTKVAFGALTSSSIPALIGATSNNSLYGEY